MRNQPRTGSADMSMPATSRWLAGLRARPAVRHGPHHHVRRLARLHSTRHHPHVRHDLPKRDGQRPRRLAPLDAETPVRGQRAHRRLLLRPRRPRHHLHHDAGRLALGGAHPARIAARVHVRIGDRETAGVALVTGRVAHGGDGAVYLRSLLAHSPALVGQDRVGDAVQHVQVVEDVGCLRAHPGVARHDLAREHHPLRTLRHHLAVHEVRHGLHGRFLASVPRDHLRLVKRRVPTMGDVERRLVARIEDPEGVEVRLHHDARAPHRDLQRRGAARDASGLLRQVVVHRPVDPFLLLGPGDTLIRHHVVGLLVMHVGSVDRAEQRVHRLVDPVRLIRHPRLGAVEARVDRGGIGKGRQMQQVVLL